MRVVNIIVIVAKRKKIVSTVMANIKNKRKRSTMSNNKPSKNKAEPAMKASVYIEIKGLDKYQAALLTITAYRTQMKTESKWEAELKKINKTTITK